MQERYVHYTKKRKDTNSRCLRENSACFHNIKTPNGQFNFIWTVNFRTTQISTCPERGVANGKSETHRDAETDVLKSEPETKKCNNFTEKQIFDRQTQNLRLRDPLVDCARFRDLGRICRAPFTTPRKQLSATSFKNSY